MKNKTNKLFAVFLLGLISVPLPIFAQEATTSAPIQKPNVVATGVDFDKHTYNSGENIVGSFDLTNRRDFDTGNVYYEIALVGTEERGRSPRTAYTFSPQEGPFYVPSNESTKVDFEFALPKAKPATYLGLRIDVFVNETHIGRTTTGFSSRGEVKSYMNILSPEIKVGNDVLNFLDKPIVYEGEDLSFRYSLKNPTNERVVLEPQFLVRDLNDSENVYARYKEDKIAIPPRSTVFVSNDARVFFDEPGFYSAQMKLIDESGQERTTPIVFSYVVDGDIATIESLIADSDDTLSRNEGFIVSLFYKGKPVDVRDPMADQTQNVTISVEVTDTKGNVISKVSDEVKLLSRGQFEIPMQADRSAQGYTIIASISKDGITLTENVLEVPSYSNGFSFSHLISIILGILLVGAVILYFRKGRGPKVTATVMFLLLIAGAAYTTSAYSTIYEVSSDSNFSPTNIVTEIYDGYIGAGGFWINEYFDIYISFDDTVSFNTPDDPGGGYDWTLSQQYPADPIAVDDGWTIKSMWDALPTSYGGGYGDVYSGYTDPWYDGPPTAQLTPDACDSGYSSCDFTNETFWQKGTYATQTAYSCTSGSCSRELAITLNGPSNTGTYDLHLYVRNDTAFDWTREECDQSCEYFNDTTYESYASLIRETGLTFEDPYFVPDDTDPFCYPSVSNGATTTQTALPEQEVTWHVGWEDCNLVEAGIYECTGGFPDFYTYVYGPGGPSHGLTDSTFLFDWSGDDLTGGALSDQLTYDGESPPSDYVFHVVPEGTDLNDHCSAYSNHDHDVEFSNIVIDADTNGSTTPYSYNATDNVCERQANYCRETTEDVCTEECYTDYDWDNCYWDEDLQMEVCEEIQVCEETCTEQMVTTCWSTDQQSSPQIEFDTLYGQVLTDTYATSTATSTISEVYFTYNESCNHVPYGQSGSCQDEHGGPTGGQATIQCMPLNVGQDVCANIDGHQTAPPSGFDVYPDPEDVDGVTITYDDLSCFPVSLAVLDGTLSLTASPSSADLDENVEWTFTLSDAFFQGMLDDVLYTIPRFATITWSGDVTDAAYTGGYSGSIENEPALISLGLPDTDSDILVSYSESGSPGVTITIDDEYVTLTDTAYVTVEGETCEEKCNSCPTEDPCDNGDDSDNAQVSNFTIDPAIANANNNCELSWITNEYTESCTLIGPTTSTDVATSSSGTPVSPGTYLLSCLNYAPEITTAGPVTCLQNPDFKED